MTYTTIEGRQKVLTDLGIAIEQIAVSLAALEAAYEALDEIAADALEERLFRPAQLAYGRAKRTHREFAARSGLSGRSFDTPTSGPQSQSAQTLIDRAAFAAAQADQTIFGLQDSMLPVEVGDPELRAGLSSAREALAAIPLGAREIVRTVGR
jgi:hypothetical protein